MLFGEKIKQLRQEKNLTQPELAEALGIEQSWLSKIENDKCAPSAELLDAFQTFFGLTPAKLFAGLDTQNLRSQMGSLTVVSDFLKAEIQHLESRKRRLFSAGAIAVFAGVGLWYAGFMALFYSETLYEYQSDGVLFTGEPYDLYFDVSRAAVTLGLVMSSRSDEALQGEPTQFRDLTEVYRHVESRRDAEVTLLADYRGESYTESAAVPANALNIFFSTPDSGFRNYNLVSVRNTESMPNQLLQWLGALLLLAGVLILLMEFRLGKQH